MNISKDIRINLDKEERQAVESVYAIVSEFADKNLCDNMACYDCPLAMFCEIADNAKDFETTLKDIANM